MTLLNVIVLASKTIKGSRNKVRISVAHNGETHYIITDIILDPNKEFKNGKREFGIRNMAFTHIITFPHWHIAKKCVTLRKRNE